MLPNYSGKLLDKIILIAAKQTAPIRHNPDDPEYVEARISVVRSLSWALWEVRNELQAKRTSESK